MSGDEYDDELSDDEFGENFKSPAHEALERLEARKPPTDKDAGLIGPILRRYADQEKIPFLVVQNGLVLGFKETPYPDYLGGHHVRHICQSAERTFLIDRCISAIALDSEGAVGGGGLLYTGDLEEYSDGHDDGDGYDWETPYQEAGFEKVFDDSQKRLMLAEIDKLEGQGETIETNKELAFYKKELGLNTYQGRTKSADPEADKIRQRVFQDVQNFYEMLEGKKFGNDESRLMAAYFRKYIKTGRSCRYTGPWKFKYS